MNFYITLLEQYALMESLDSIIKSNPHIPEQTIRNYHTNALPDNNKNDRLLNHVLKLHKSGAITPETAHLLKPHLTALSTTNQLNKLKNLNTLADHQNATKDILDKAVTKKQRVDINTPTVFENNDILVRKHLTHESAVKGARLHPANPVFNEPREKGKAAWCVSIDGETGNGFYEKYTENVNPMYTIFNKKTKRSTAYIPGQDTYDRNEMRDEKDKPVSPYKLLKDNPGIEHTEIGAHINKYMPEVHDVIKTVPFNADKQQLLSAINSNNTRYKNAAMAHNLTPHMDEISKGGIIHLIKAGYPLEPNHIDSLVDSKDSDIQTAIAAYPGLPMHHINHFMRHKSVKLRASVATNPSITDHHREMILKDKPSVILSAIDRSNLYVHQLHQLIDHDNEDIGWEAGSALNYGAVLDPQNLQA